MTEMTRYEPGTFCWVELATSDGSAAKSFYTNLFGWTANEIPIGEGSVYVMLQKSGKDVGALYENKNVPPNWLSYVAVASADETGEKAKSLGATIVATPFDVFDVGRMAVITDPQGATFALWQARKHIGAGVVGEPGALCWNELATRDKMAAADFYSKLFGWEPRHHDSGPMPYTEFHRGERALGGMYTMPSQMEGVPPHWMVYFATDDCDATEGKARSLGGTSIVASMDIPDVGRFAAIRDPQGAVFSVIRLDHKPKQ